MTRANSFNSRALFYTPAHWLGSNAPGVAAHHWPGYRSVAIDARPVLTHENTAVLRIGPEGSWHKHASQKCNFRRKTAVLRFWNLMYRVCVISIENRRVCPNAASLMIRNSQRGYHTDHLRARTSVSYRVAQRKMHCHLELFAVESCGF